MDAREQMALAPFLHCSARREAAAQHVALALQAGQGEADVHFRQADILGQQCLGARAEAGQAGADDFHQRLFRRPAFAQFRRQQQRRFGMGGGMHDLQLGKPLGRHPQRSQPSGAAGLEQLRQQRRPAFIGYGLVGADETEAAQRLVHLVRIARFRPGFGAHRGDRLGIQRAEVVGGFRIGPATALHGLGAALLQRCVVEIGVGIGGQHFRRQRGGRRQVAGVQFDRPGLHAPQQRQPAFAVHGLVQAVVQRLRHQRVIGNLPLADDVLQARHLVGEHRRQQVLAAHALQLRRHLSAATEARQGQRGGGVPAPAHAEQRRIQQRLDQHVFRAVGVQVAPHLVEREAVAGGQRQDDRVLGGRRLQLEVEVAAEALAQRQAPGAVDAAAEGRMDHQLHAAGFVEEALQHQLRLARQHAQRRPCAGQVFDHLPRRRLVEAEFASEPADGRRQRFGAALAFCQ
ncbi:hypothetical protein D9M70_220080 [compost metagenome]